MVIASGDLDFVPLVVRLRERGIRVLCVSERSKMAQDAVRAYDEVIYVADGSIAQPLSNAKGKSEVVSEPTVPAPIKHAAAKPLAPKSAAAKVVPAKKAPAKAVAKKAAGKAPEAITVRIIPSRTSRNQTSNTMPYRG
jgi:hypothetical protein